ncbi:MAG: ACT domain-containing protein [Cellulosilyticum sp.]|nr:ACT domain-containing protein [Cellulosilyticum sp.]
MQLTLKLMEGHYGVCRLEPKSIIPTWCQQGEFFSVTKTMDELSIICLETYIPEDVQVEKEWCILKIVGPLDFSLVGILSKISQLMAECKISIFALSTYDTDYILIKQAKITEAIQALKTAGYHIISS